MSKTLPTGIFPSQSVSNEEKASYDYGMKVAKAIEGEWFKRDTGSSRYFANRDNFHKLRLYARGEQSIQKYKDELSVNGDLSYLNLDWKPVPIIPKFVDIVVNGIAERAYDIKAFAQDPASVQKKTRYMEGVLQDMRAKEFIQHVKDNIGVDTTINKNIEIPETPEELELHMQLDYKESIEIAAEEAINNVFDHNKFELLKKRLDYDLAVIGIACVKNGFNTAEGITLQYVDPADIVYSYTNSPYFDDLYYVGEVRRTTIPELKKQHPELTDEDIKDIEGLGTNHLVYNRPYGAIDSNDKSYIYVLDFEYKTYKNQVYKIKQTASGAEKIIEKPDTFNPPVDARSRFDRVARSIETVYCGSKIIGSEKLLKWYEAENMVRPNSDTTKVQLGYNIVAPRIYQGKIESLVSRMTSFADMIQLTHLKLQQVLSKMVPDGVYLDADGITEIDLGNGTNYNPQEALNMYFQTGSVIGRSYTQDGEFNNGKIPIQPLANNSGNAKIASLIQSYNYYMQMLRDVTGLNEARDGSMPSENSLVGLQKIAAANSNTATRHILQGGLYLTLKTAEAINLRIADVLEFSNTKQSFVAGIGQVNVATLEEMANLHLHDFGVFLQLTPDDEEKQLLENNIQMALSKGQIHLEDAIDIREVKNLKLANQLLKLRRKRKQAEDRAVQMENINAQAESNAKAAQAAAMADVQKQQATAETKIQISTAEIELQTKKLEREAEIKKELMFFEYELNMKLKQADLQVINSKEEYKEDRKDKRTKLQASQQSELINQRKNNTPPKNFESAGFDNLGGFGLEQFEPR